MSITHQKTLINIEKYLKHSVTICNGGGDRTPLHETMTDTKLDTMTTTMKKRLTEALELVCMAAGPRSPEIQKAATVPTSCSCGD